jgi:hypothetical protein
MFGHLATEIKSKGFFSDPTTFVIKRVLALENDIVQNRKT